MNIVELNQNEISVVSGGSLFTLLGGIGFSIIAATFYTADVMGMLRKGEGLRPISKAMGNAALTKNNAKTGLVIAGFIVGGNLILSFVGGVVEWFSGDTK